MGNSRQVVLAAFQDATEAHMLRARLEAEGIECWIEDENMASVYPVYGLVVGGVKVKVRAEEAARAGEVLGRSPVATTEPFTCPACGSSDVGANPVGFMWLLLLTLVTFGLYMPLWYKRFRCGDCGCRWQGAKDPA